MPLANEFFRDQKEWSKRKLVIIEKYLAGFAPILGQRYKKVFYVDGFAGKGMYEDNEFGSPVRAAVIANSYQDSNKPFQLNCINVESDSDNYYNLVLHTKKYFPLVKNYFGTFADNLNSILKDITGYPTLFFLDDFGICGTDWATVKKLLSREDPTDLWIRFDHKTIRRLDGSFYSRAIAANNRFHRLKRYYGEDNAITLHTELNGETSKERIRRSVDLYRHKLESATTETCFTAAYPIISLDNQNKYHLVFWSKHPTAAILANTVVNLVEETFQRELHDHKEKIRLTATRQPRLLDMDPDEKTIFQNKVNVIKRMIKKFSGKTFTVKDLYFELLKNNRFFFGKFRQTHITKALQQLAQSDQINLSGPPSHDRTKVIIK